MSLMALIIPKQKDFYNKYGGNRILAPIVDEMIRKLEVYDCITCSNIAKLPDVSDLHFFSDTIPYSDIYSL